MEKYDSIVISTWPSRRIDRKRTLDSITKVEEKYGSLIRYDGLWIAAGTLGGIDYENSQRKGIYDLMVEKGIVRERIREIDGEDTANKTKLIIDSSKIWAQKQ